MSRRRPEPADVALLHVDERLVVVAKPPFVLVQDAPGREDAVTLLPVVAERLRARGERAELHLVHRLDEECSGALVLARDVEAKQALEDLFRRHALERVYHAVLRGRPVPPQGRLVDRLRERGDLVEVVDRGGERAVLDYAVVAALGDRSVVACRLETGRRNQIRVQWAARGHVLVGDRKYGDRGREAGRTMLHATALALTPPWSGHRLEVIAPFAPDFAALLGPELAASLLPGRH